MMKKGLKKPFRLYVQYSVCYIEDAEGEVICSIDPWDKYTDRGRPDYYVYFRGIK